MLPAGERLEADDAHAPKVEDRLVVDHELVALQRDPELRLDIQALQRVAAAERVEQADAPARVALCPDERDLRLLEHVAAAGAARQPHRDAHAGADEPGAAVQVERRLELKLEAIGERECGVGIAARQQQGEGVPAEPCNGVR